jgi:hypothetical protein
VDERLTAVQDEHLAAAAAGDSGQVSGSDLDRLPASR